MEAIDIIYSDLYHKLWGKILNLKRIFIDQDNVKLHLCVFLKHVVIDWISSKCWPGGKTFCLLEMLMFTFVLFGVMKILWLWNFIDRIESYWSKFLLQTVKVAYDLSFASTKTKFKNPITKTQNNFLVNTGFLVKLFQKNPKW